MIGNNHPTLGSFVIIFILSFQLSFFFNFHPLHFLWTSLCVILPTSHFLHNKNLHRIPHKDKGLEKQSQDIRQPKFFWWFDGENDFSIIIEPHDTIRTFFTNRLIILGITVMLYYMYCRYILFKPKVMGIGRDVSVFGQLIRKGHGDTRILVVNFFLEIQGF